MRIAPALALALLALATAGAAVPVMQGVPIGGAMRVGMLMVSPRAVLEDSRCPAAVSCIWAGRLRLRVALRAGRRWMTRDLTLGEPVVVAGQALSLAAVRPERRAEDALASAAYRFVFTDGMAAR